MYLLLSVCVYLLLRETCLGVMQANVYSCVQIQVYPKAFTHRCAWVRALIALHPRQAKLPGFYGILVALTGQGPA